jgi:hypothetical protein
MFHLGELDGASLFARDLDPGPESELPQRKLVFGSAAAAAPEADGDASEEGVAGLVGNGRKRSEDEDESEDADFDFDDFGDDEEEGGEEEEDVGDEEFDDDEDDDDDDFEEFEDEGEDEG